MNPVVLNAVLIAVGLLALVGFAIWLNTRPISPVSREAVIPPETVELALPSIAKLMETYVNLIDVVRWKDGEVRMVVWVKYRGQHDYEAKKFIIDCVTKEVTKG